MVTSGKGLSHALQVLQVSTINITEKMTDFPFQWYPLSSRKMTRTRLILPLKLEFFQTFSAFLICPGVTSKQNVKRYVSTSGVYTQIMPGNVTRIDQSASPICVKTGLSGLNQHSNNLKVVRTISCFY